MLNGWRKSAIGTPESQFRIANKPRALGAARNSAAHGAAPLGMRIAQGMDGGQGAMDAIVIVGAVVGSFAGAFVLQKAALEGLFRMMNADRRTRH